MTVRERLPDRRLRDVFEFRHCYPGGKPQIVTASVGRFADGRVAEVFIDLVRTEENLCMGTDKAITVDAHDASVVLSFALQHGADLPEIGKALLHGEDGVAHGFMGALIDALIRYGACP